MNLTRRLGATALFAMLAGACGPATPSVGPDGATSDASAEAGPGGDAASDSGATGPAGRGHVLLLERGSLVVVRLDDRTRVATVALPEDHRLSFAALSEDGATLTFKTGEGDCTQRVLATGATRNCNAPGAMLVDFPVAAGARAGDVYNVFVANEDDPGLTIARVSADGAVQRLGFWNPATLGAPSFTVGARDGSRLVARATPVDPMAMGRSLYLSIGADAGPTSEPALLFSLGERAVSSLCSLHDLSRDGNVLAHCVADPGAGGLVGPARVLVRDLRTEREVTFANAQRFALSPDGARLAWVSPEGALRTALVAMPDAVVTSADTVEPVANLAFTLDGERLVVDQTARGVLTYDARSLGDARVVVPSTGDLSMDARLGSEQVQGHRDLTSR